MSFNDILFLTCLMSIFFCGFLLGKNYKEYIWNKETYATEDLNQDELINCKDVQRDVFECFKGNNYYVQNCRTENETDAHAWAKVWINYIPFEGNSKDTCKECITDIYGKCINYK